MCMLILNFLAFIVPEISTFIQADMVTWTIDPDQEYTLYFIYTLYGRKRFLLLVT